MSYETIHFDLADGVATITLDRASGANTLNLALASDLYSAAVRCEAREPVRAVLITGAGKMFCAGGDLKEFHDSGDAVGETITRVTSKLHGALSIFARMDAPVVMAVNGTAAGAGFSLACSGDYVIASSEAKFTMAYTAAGLSSDGSSTWYVARHIGLLRTKELMLTNRRLSAQQALEWGAVNHVVPPQELMPAARKIAADFACGPTRAYGTVKRLLLNSSATGLASQMDAEASGIAQMATTRDGRNAMDAFLNKRKPKFTGE